jgi:hypothetical protein
MLFSVPGLFQLYVSSEATDRSFRTDPAQMAVGALNVGFGRSDCAERPGFLSGWMTAIGNEAGIRHPQLDTVWPMRIRCTRTNEENQGGCETKTVAFIRSFGSRWYADVMRFCQPFNRIPLPFHRWASADTTHAQRSAQRGVRCGRSCDAQFVTAINSSKIAG